jgi:hypothetical protein
MGNAYFLDYYVNVTDAANTVRIGSNKQIKFGPYIDAISQTELSLYGDAELTIVGSGFSSADFTGDIIFKNTADREFNCISKSVEYTEIVCQLDRIVSDITAEDYQLFAWLETAPAVKDLTEKGLLLSARQYNLYTTVDMTDAATPKITSTSPDSVNAEGETLTVQGTVRNHIILIYDPGKVKFYS